MNINWDKYYSKHCARFYGWLPASQEFHKTKKKPLKYFTLCGRKAIDIFMLELAGVLKRDKNGMLSGITICEKDEDQVPEILELIRPPLGREAIIPAPLQKVLTFEDDNYTRGKTILDSEEDRPNPELRKKLIIKDFALRIQTLFPFDIINFDPNENLLRSPNQLLYGAFEKIFQLQKVIDSFLIFVTTSITHIHPDFKTMFRRDFDSNVDNYPEIRTSLEETVNTVQYEQLPENNRIAISIAKSTIAGIARNNGWNTEHKGIYIYENNNLRKMLNCVVQLTKVNPESEETLYVEDIKRIIKEMPKFFSYEDSLQNQEVITHLEQVKELRKRIRAEYKL